MLGVTRLLKGDNKIKLNGLSEFFLFYDSVIIVFINSAYIENGGFVIQIS